MRYRDSPILAYYDNSIIICRLCILEKILGHTLVFGDKCHNHDMFKCCSCGFNHTKIISKTFRFDNSKNKIVISEGKCNVCTYFELQCIEPCRYDIKKRITNIIDVIDNTKRG